MVDIIEKTFVIIPAFNEAKTIKNVIFDIRRYLPRIKIIIIDDGSTDGTGFIANHCNVKVISHRVNSGKGSALRTGFKAALEAEGRFLVTIDGDGQHDPRFIKDLLEKVEKNAADIAVGTRMHNLTAMPFHRILSNFITSILISLRVGEKIEDSQCGFRAINSNVFKKIKLTYGGFQTESELLMRAGMAGFKIANVPILTIYGTSKSSIHNVRDTLKFIYLFFQSFYW